MTWQALPGLIFACQAVCIAQSTLIIADEAHHPHSENRWGEATQKAFEKAAYKLCLTGTHVRSDGNVPTWLAENTLETIDQPNIGKYSLTYGEAIEQGYCVPCVFHRHQGKFNVQIKGNEAISVSGDQKAIIPENLRSIKHLQNSLDFYKFACHPMFEKDGLTPDLESYQATMLKWGIQKLDDLRETLPAAAGIAIAPNIYVAEHMAQILELLTNEKPIIVHNEIKNSDQKIELFKNSRHKWIVCVAMLSEGINIKRARVLVLLPSAKTENSFRQFMGRVVRSMGNDDTSRAYVIMPADPIFDLYARRVEAEIPPSYRREKPKAHKVCPICDEKVLISVRTCPFCEHEWPASSPRMKPCPSCEGLNPDAATNCMHCGESFSVGFDLSLNEALRAGVIVRGSDIEEGEVKEGEKLGKVLREKVLREGDANIINVIRQVPEESLASLARILGDINQ